MGKTKLTQCDKVLRHLRDHGYITSLEAINEYGILRLSARIADLSARSITDMHSKIPLPSRIFPNGIPGSAVNLKK